MFMAQVDGNVSPKEKEIYRAILSRMSFEEHTPADFNRLIRDEQSILNAISQIEDIELRKTLIELLTLIAIYDGIFADEERAFLMSAAEKLEVSLDMEQVEKRVREYQDIVKKNMLEKTAVAIGSTAMTALDATSTTTNKLKDVFTKAVKRQESDQSSTYPTATHNDDPVEKLKKLKQMHDAELITSDEFDAKRAEILSAL